MNIYTFTFTGRLAGALGQDFYDTVEVLADSEEAAVRELYKAREHIRLERVACSPATCDSEGRTSLRMCREAREAASQTQQTGG